LGQQKGDRGGPKKRVEVEIRSGGKKKGWGKGPEGAQGGSLKKNLRKTNERKRYKMEEKNLKEEKKMRD